MGSPVHVLLSGASASPEGHMQPLPPPSTLWQPYWQRKVQHFGSPERYTDRQTIDMQLMAKQQKTNRPALAINVEQQRAQHKVFFELVARGM